MNTEITPNASNTTTASEILGNGVATPTQAPEVKAEPKISPQLHALMRRERAAVDRERAAQAKEAAILDREKRIQEFEALKANPLKAIEQYFGLTYDDLTKIQLSDGQITPDIHVKRVEDKVDSFLKAQEQEKLARAEEAKKLEERKLDERVVQFKAEIGQYLKDNSERYELIQFEQNESLIYEVIEEHYDRTLKAAQAKAKEAGEDPNETHGEVMTIAAAADKIEQHLEEKYNKARSLNKVKTLLAPKPESFLDKQANQQISQKPKTLTNTLSATPTAPRKGVITDDERIQKAIAYARGLRP